MCKLKSVDEPIPSERILLCISSGTAEYFNAHVENSFNSCSCCCCFFFYLLFKWFFFSLSLSLCILLWLSSALDFCDPSSWKEPDQHPLSGPLFIRYPRINQQGLQRWSVSSQPSPAFIRISSAFHPHTSKAYTKYIHKLLNAFWNIGSAVAWENLP